MSLIVFASVKGSPGVTSTAVGVAAAWPGDESTLVVECDPSGGDIAARFGVRVSPGLVEMAAAYRPGQEPDGWRVFAQTIYPGQTPVLAIPAPAGGLQVQAALPVLTRPGCKALIPPDATALADVGQLTAQSAAWPLLGMADAVVLVAPGDVAAVAHLKAHAPGIRATCGDRCVVAVIGGSYPSGDVAAVLAPHGISVVGTVPHTRSAKRLADGRRFGIWHSPKLTAWQTLQRSIAAHANSVPLPATETDTTL